METEFNSNFCQNQTFILITLKTEEFSEPWLIRLVCRCCPVQCAHMGSLPPWFHPSLCHPSTPREQFEAGSPWVPASPVRFAICHHRAAWSDTVHEEITTTSLAQGTSTQVHMAGQNYHRTRNC